MERQYLQGLDRSTFEWLLSEAQYDRGQQVKPRVSVALMDGDERSRTGMTAFTGVVDAAGSLDCVVEDTPVKNGREVKVTNSKTRKSATLTVQYEGQTYSPSIMLGTHRQVSLKKDTAKKLRALIVDYLTGRMTTRQISTVRGKDKDGDKEGQDSGSVPVLAATPAEELYEDLERKFED